MHRAFLRPVFVHPRPVSETDIFASLTCKFHIITFVHMKKLNNSAFVGNTRHFNNEIDFAGSEGLVSMNIDNIKLRHIFLSPRFFTNQALVRMLKFHSSGS